MKIKTLFPQVKEQPESRPKRCNRRNSPYRARRGVAPKTLEDTRVTRVKVERYRCSGCKRTFRRYPEGVGRATQSKRLIGLAAIMPGLGLSGSGASHVLRGLEASISGATVWRDAQAIGMVLKKRPFSGGRARAIGADETIVRLKGRGVVLGFVVNARTGETLGVAVLVEQDAGSFLLGLRKIAREAGAEALATDDLATYKPVAEELGLKHQVCLTHVRKNVTKMLKRLPGQEPLKELVRELIEELPAWGGRALRQLAKSLGRNTPWRMFLTALANKWESLRLYLEEEGALATNNSCEQCIGRSKALYKTTRGLKSESGMLNFVALTQWLYTNKDAHDLRELVA